MRKGNLVENGMSYVGIAEVAIDKFAFQEILIVQIPV